MREVAHKLNLQKGSISDFLVKDVFNGSLNEQDFEFLERVWGWRVWKRASTERCIKVAKRDQIPHNFDLVLVTNFIFVLKQEKEITLNV